MAACERCWADAYVLYRIDGMKSQVEHYHDLLAERVDDPECRSSAAAAAVQQHRNGTERD